MNRRGLFGWLTLGLLGAKLPAPEPKPVKLFDEECKGYLVTDGWDVIKWQESYDLLVKLGVSPQDYEKANGFELRLGRYDSLAVVGLCKYRSCDEETLRSDYIRVPCDLICHELYNSDEFKAFCHRFGIAWEKDTTWIVIRAVEGECPEVTQSYRGRSLKPKPRVCEYPPPGVVPTVIDTTSHHNKQYVTKAPGWKRA